MTARPRRRGARAWVATAFAGGLAAASATGEAAAGPAPLCREAVYPLDPSIGGTPVARLPLAGRTGAVLIDTGATRSAVDASAAGVAAGAAVELEEPLCGGRRAFVAEDMQAYRAPAGGQLGRIGTDVLGAATIVFAYGPVPTLAVRSGAIDPAAAAASGLVEVGVRERAPAGGVPVVGLAIGPVAVPAELDTGFDDGVDPGIVQGGPALLAALRAAGVSMRPAAPGRTLGCSGLRPYPRWRIEAADLVVRAAAGSVAAAFPPPLVEIKDDAACGGVATFDAPFAEIGASWLARFGVTVVDGPGGTVWIRRR